MKTKVVRGFQKENLEKCLHEAWYAGERFIVKGKEGDLAAIVPMEDLAVLEQIESLKCQGVSKKN